MSSQYVELRPVLTADIDWQVCSTPANSMGFAFWLRYCTHVAQQRSTKLCTIFGRLLGLCTIYIYIFGGYLHPNGSLPVAKFTLHPSLAFCISSVTAWHSSSGRQPNCGVVKAPNLRHSLRRAAIMLGIGPHSSFDFVCTKETRTAK